MLQYRDERARKLEAIYTSADVVAQRWATLERLNLRAGEAVIDIGCGPGFLCEQMADAVGNTGRVLGIDISKTCWPPRVRGTPASGSLMSPDAAALGAPD